jgi:hypothetical protein
MKLLIAAAVLAALAVPADAAEWKRIKGVTYFSDQVWTNQLDGDPVVELPRGCRGAACDFTVWLFFVPVAQNDDRCGNPDSPDTPWKDCEGFPQCALWVEFGDDILPMRTNHGRDGGGRQKDNYAWITAPINHYPNGTPVIITSHTLTEGFRGRQYQTLVVLAFEVEIFPRSELCRVGIELAFHPSSKSIFDRGLMLPR